MVQIRRITAAHSSSRFSNKYINHRLVGLPSSQEEPPENQLILQPADTSNSSALASLGYPLRRDLLAIPIEKSQLFKKVCDSKIVIKHTKTLSHVFVMPALRYATVHGPKLDLWDHTWFHKWNMIHDIKVWHTKRDRIIFHLWHKSVKPLVTQETVVKRGVVLQRVVFLDIRFAVQGKS